MRIPAAFAAVVLIAASTVWSQTRAGTEPGNPRVDFSAGARFTGSNPGQATDGFGASVFVHPWSWVGLGGEYEAYFGTAGVANSTVLSDYLFGPEFLLPRSGARRVTPFAQALFGGQSLHNGSTQHSYYYTNGAGLAIAANGGIDLRVSRHFALRGQAGLLHSHFAVDGGSPVSNNRWTVGLSGVYRF